MRGARAETGVRRRQPEDLPLDYPDPPPPAVVPPCCEGHAAEALARAQRQRQLDVREWEQEGRWRGR